MQIVTSQIISLKTLVAAYSSFTEYIIAFTEF